MYCKDCGNELQDNSQFCPKCGSRIGIKESYQSGNVVSVNRYLFIVIGLIFANLAVVFMPFYKMLGIEMSDVVYSFMDLKEINILMSSFGYRYEMNIDTYDLLRGIAITIMCLGILLIIIAVVQLTNAANRSVKGFKKISTKLIIATIINTVEIVYMISVEAIYSYEKLPRFSKFTPTFLYFFVAGFIIAIFFAEVGIRNAWKKQEQ